MENSYNGAPELDFWLVNKEHLTKIYNLFLNRFIKREINIEITSELRGGKQQEKCSDFKIFDQSIKNIISLKRKILDIEFCAFSSKTNIFSKYAKLDINFYINRARGYVSGTDNNGEVKDWTYGFKDDIQGLLNSFRPDSKIIQTLKNRPENKYRESIIIFDYDNKIFNNMLPLEKTPSIILQQIHQGIGDNIQGTKITSFNTQPTKKWYKDPAIIVPLIIAIISISIPWWSGVIKHFQNNIADLQKDNINFSTSTINLQSNSLLRALEPLETGKKISQLPNNVYFFDTANAVTYELGSSSDDFIEAKGYRMFNDCFEMQKIDNRYYIIGFISDEAYAQIGSINSSNTLDVVVFPYPWGNSDKVVGIPFDYISTISYRRINIDKALSINILDIKTGEIITNVISHELPDSKN